MEIHLFIDFFCVYFFLFVGVQLRFAFEVKIDATLLSSFFCWWWPRSTLWR